MESSGLNTTITTENTMPKLSAVNIRPAVLADCEAINAIYNYYVAQSTCTYQLEPSTAEERAEWFHGHGPRQPILVAEEHGRVIGWGSLSPFRERAGYRFTIENSIYIHHDHHRRGIGARMLEELIALAREHGYRVLIAGVDGEQDGSKRLHQKYGFVEVAHFRNIGFKFERWLDVFFYQLELR